ncbi:prepilin-type processing-associated H-X9-DG domain-containing protein [Neorhodopirellula lusitana]|uniref:Prepilin-type processing-associated H-X9-DG domain-containing protein n=2 Tax=Neorhodopirellula lusitana TaxID=445327 RepID=A0ABY1QKJ6_9BACT|nr:prepilin-type processing-associated H-X9-DG domain-containing protein [Neorhodopirellula lusitana]
MGEIATDLGDNDKRTRSASGGGSRYGGDLRKNIQACKGFTDPERPQFWVASNSIGTAEQGRGYKWAGGQPLYTACYTIFPPNREICTDGGAQRSGIYTFSSRHQGGCHVLMGDGAVKFITDSVEAGEADTRLTVVFWDEDGDGDDSIVHGSPSVFGLWGALGTVAGDEVIDQDF